MPSPSSTGSRRSPIPQSSEAPIGTAEVWGAAASTGLSAGDFPVVFALLAEVVDIAFQSKAPVDDLLFRALL